MGVAAAVAAAKGMTVQIRWMTTGRCSDNNSNVHGSRQVRVLHGSEEYLLRLTRNNKLILTK